MKESYQFKAFCECVQRMQDRKTMIAVYLDPASATSLIASIQLALRHPGNVGPTAEINRKLADALIARLEQDEPALGPILRLGYDPSSDIE